MYTVFLQCVTADGVWVSALRCKGTWYVISTSSTIHTSNYLHIPKNAVIGITVLRLKFIICYVT